VDEFEPGEDDADGDDHHAGEPDRHVTFEKFDVGSEFGAQRGDIGLGGKLDSLANRLGHVARLLRRKTRGLKAARQFQGIERRRRSLVGALPGALPRWGGSASISFRRAS